MFHEDIAANVTAFEDKSFVTSEIEFVGSKTETALLRIAKDRKWASYQPTRQAADAVKMIPFPSEGKAIGVVIRTTSGKFRLYLKGASEILTKIYKRHVTVSLPGTKLHSVFLCKPMMTSDRRLGNYPWSLVHSSL
jgi:Ca2+-transporting ATPase